MDSKRIDAYRIQTLKKVHKMKRMSYSKASQSLGFEGVGNARDLGGYRTIDGHTIRRESLLRTAMPLFASKRDRARMRDDFNLTLVLDFRMQMELRQAPQTGSTSHTVGGDDANNHHKAQALSFARTEHIPILNEEKLIHENMQMMKELGEDASPLRLIITGVDLGIVGPNMYIGFLEDDCGKRGYSTMFRRLIEQPDDEALLFHCSQGKDRTGLAAMLILSTLGVDDETIVFDYLLTNEFNASIIKRERQALLQSGIAEEKLDTYMLGMDQVYPITMHNAIDHLTRTYGSVWGYVHQELGVSSDERTELLHKYLA